MKFRLPVLMAGALALALTSAASAADIVDTAVAGHFNTLVAAVKAAGLVDTLKGPGPFTVFAPTDEAFAKLPAGTVETLLKPENKDKLVAILTYHVVAGNVMAKDVVKLNAAKTVQGGDVRISAMGGKVMINDAHVTKADIVRTFIFTGPDDGKRTRMTLGSYPALTLAAARTRAAQARGCVEERSTRVPP